MSQSPPHPKPGIILSMMLQNFMCHDHLAFEFNSHLNFIVGPNGSGKSAVLTGLKVALGAAAKEMERAKLGDLVKKGCTSGSVSVTLSNYGPFGYKKDVYGSAITIVRTLKTSGRSSFQIFDFAGIVQDHTRDAIEQITAALNIPINNPMCILTQNTAKTFLSTCSPAELYYYFYTASSLSNAKEHLERTYKDLKEMKSVIQAKSEILEKIDEEVEEKRKKLQLAQDLASEVEKLKKLKDEYQRALEQRCTHLARHQNLLATKLYYNLKGILAIREFNVETDIDFESERFLLKISPKGGDCQDVASLSEGERSLSTLALILAIWEIADQPFRVMDQFDVFMDGVNRQFALDFILKSSSNKPNSQYILITPLSIDIPEDGSIGIHSLGEAMDVDIQDKFEEAIEERYKCKVCLDKRIEVIFLPCGHLASCSSCTSALANCPLCRQVIGGTAKTFLP